MRSVQRPRIIRALTDKGYTAVELASVVHCTVYGIGVDAVKPKPLTVLEKARKWKANESVEHREFRLARQRQLRRKVKRDPLVAAFYGLVK
jgi:hypothetical protein